MIPMEQITAVQAVRHGIDITNAGRLINAVAEYTRLHKQGEATVSNDDQLEAAMRDQLEAITSLGPGRTKSVLVVLAGMIANAADQDELQHYIDGQMEVVRVVLERDAAGGASDV